MNEYKEYLETGILGSYKPESAIIKNSTAVHRWQSSVIQPTRLPMTPAPVSVKC